LCKANDGLCQDTVHGISTVISVKENKLYSISSTKNIGSGSFRTSTVSVMPVEMAELPLDPIF